MEGFIMRSHHGFRGCMSMLVLGLRRSGHNTACNAAWACTAGGRQWFVCSCTPEPACGLPECCGRSLTATAAGNMAVDLSAPGVGSMGVCESLMEC